MDHREGGRLANPGGEHVCSEWIRQNSIAERTLTTLLRRLDAYAISGFLGRSR